MAELIYEGKWDEHQDLRGFWWHAPPPEIVTDRVRVGIHALRSFLEWPNAGDWDRSEIACGLDNDAIPDTPGIQQLLYGTRHWIGLSIFVPEDLPIVDKKPRLTDVVFQMHGKRDKDNGVVVENPRNPNFSIEVDSNADVWRIYTRGDDRRVTPKDKSYQFSHSFDLPLTKGKWTDWVVEMLLSFHDDGELRIWQDGDVVYEGQHKNCWNDDRGPHIGFGVYAWWIDNEYGIETYREYYHDAFKVAVGEDGYDVVAPEVEPDPEPEPHEHPEIISRLVVIEEATKDLREVQLSNEPRIKGLEQAQAEMSVKLDAQEESIENLATTQVAQDKKIQDLEQAQIDDETQFAKIRTFFVAIRDLINEFLG